MYPGKSVLIHCAQGKSRSAVVAVAFLAKTTNVSVAEALDTVKTGRAMAQPNPSFWQQLLDMEKEQLFSLM